MNKVYFKLILLFLLIFTASISAQITTSSISGSVKDDKGIAIPFATVVATHTPTRSNYVTTTREDGSFNINGMKVGGPYTVKGMMTGFQTAAEENIYLQLAVPYKVKMNLKSSTTLGEVLVISKSENRLLASNNQGTATNIGRRTIESLPTLSRSITDFTKLTPQSNGTSFGGQDNRLNNLSIDGSTFNNNFGLQALPGSQTNSTPISLDAIEEIQVNLSPYNLRERDFTGAGINAVTRSGTNDFSGSAFFNTRNRDFAGKKAAKTDVSNSIASFDVKQFGFRLGGPIIKNKLFFFINGEAERRTDPGTTFFANNNNGTIDNNETVVLQSDLDNLSSFLNEKYGYKTGKYQDYNLNTFSNKFLAKLDWNINDKHKFSVRYSYLRSERDVPVSNSGAQNLTLGRRDNAFAMVFRNSNYLINNDIQSITAELNSNFSSRISNNFIFGFTANRDYRTSNSTPFPFVDILNGGNNYITFGYELFTPNNRLNSDNYQIQNNSTIELKRGHSLSFGVNYERFEFVNTFTPNLYGQYTFNSLKDFYLSSDAFLSNKPDTVKKNYSLTYSNIDGGKVWDAVLKANTAGAYIQDNWTPTERFNLNFGVRVDVPFFSSKGAQNDSVAKYNFRDGDNGAYKISTSDLPEIKNNVLVSPRVGFNWDIYGNKSFIIRGGTGLFSGRPPFVWIANQFGNNGVQSGSISSTLGTGGVPAQNPNFPFNPSVTANIPQNLVPNTPARSYNIAATDPNFKYPQLWKGNVAIDKKIIWNIIGTFEFNASKGINDVFYINANLPADTGVLKGIDNRPKYGANRINSKITNATVLKNKNGSYAYNMTFKLERPSINGFGAMVAYNFAEAKDYIQAGSIAFNSWRDNFSVNGNNNIDLSFSNNDQRHRVISNVSYRKSFEKNFAFSINLFSESRNQGRFSYSYSVVRNVGDLNGDGLDNNDLLYVPKEGELVNFKPIAATSTSPAFSVQEQQSAFDAYINQDEYLKGRRGQYAERNGAILPWVTRFDLSTMVEFFLNVGKEKKTKHTLQLRADIFNIGNLLNPEWGVGDIVNNSQVLRYEGVSAGIPQFTMNRNSTGSLDYKTTRKSVFINDVWQAQFGVRYYF